MGDAPNPSVRRMRSQRMGVMAIVILLRLNGGKYGRRARELDRLLAERGKPKMILSDNGTDLTSRRTCAGSCKAMLAMPHGCGRSKGRASCELPRNPKIRYHSRQFGSHPENPGSQEEESLRCVTIVCTMSRPGLPRSRT